MNGILTLERIHEGSDRWISFNPPLRVEYFVDDNKDVLVVYDFGMTDTFSIKPDKNIHIGKTTDPAFGIEKTVEFDLFHAFMHTSDDPNYTHLHWALFAFLKDRVTCCDHEEPYKPRYVP
jgi:hypothetical protein